MTEYSYYHICQMIDEKERLVLESRSKIELEIRLQNLTHWMQAKADWKAK
jgi:hypothetical protein